MRRIERLALLEPLRERHEVLELRQMVDLLLKQRLLHRV